MFDETGDVQDENIFGWIGLKDNGSHYVAAAGLYDYFWAVKEETRTKIITGWITALEAYLSEDFDIDNIVPDDGILYISACEDSVEDKSTDNVIPFPKIIR